MYRIGFLDNTIHHILKSFDVVREVYPGSQLFSQEAEMYEFLETEGLDVLLMNLDLSPNDAIHLVQEIRNMNLPCAQPLLVIYTVKQEDFVQEIALEQGADAFISFHRKPAILVPFLKNMLARRMSAEPKKTGGIIVDAERHVILKNGVTIELPKKEFLLIKLLQEHQRFVSKNEIALTIWNDEKVARKRTIDVHICNLRRLLGEEAIRSKKGIGYRFNQRPFT